MKTRTVFVLIHKIEYLIQFLYLCVGNRPYLRQKPVDIGNNGVTYLHIIFSEVWLK
jgi:hypothetical protein